MRLTPAQVWLLNYLWNRGLTHTRSITNAYCVGRADPCADNNVKVMLHRLRQKMAAVISNASIETVWGQGYRLNGERDMAEYCPHCGAPLQKKGPR